MLFSFLLILQVFVWDKNLCHLEQKIGIDLIYSFLFHIKQKFQIFPQSGLN